MPKATLEWEAAVARDGRLSFTSGAADRARAFLAPENSAEAALATSLERGAALLAVGAGGNRRDAAMLESFAAVGRRVERRAAVYALGELGAAGLPVLKRLLVLDVEGLENALTCALARIHSVSKGEVRAEALRILRRLGDNAAGPLARSASVVLKAFERGDELPRQAWIGFYFELRWLAAREYGFVDGRRWRQLVLERVVSEDEFVDRVILTAAGELEEPSAKDHVIEMLREGGRVGVVRGVVAAHLDVLGQAFRLEDWRPGSRAEWAAVVAEVSSQELEASFEPLFRACLMAEPALASEANLALVRGGFEPDPAWVAGELSNGNDALRKGLLRAAARAGDPAAVPRVQAWMMESDDVRVRGEGLLALARLGHEPARERVLALLAGGPSEERLMLLVALDSAPASADVAQLLELCSALDDLTDDERISLNIGLALNRGRAERDAVWAWLATQSVATEWGARVARELGRRPTRGDAEILRDVFPVEAGRVPESATAQERARGVNVELALALIRARDPIGRTILRSALWSDAWNRSVLAGGLIWKFFGMHALMEELASRPPRVGDAGLRRVGFAIGEWGGLPAVDELARDRKERDPVLQGALLGALSARGKIEAMDDTGE